MNRSDEKPKISILHISDLHFGPPLVQDVADAVVNVAGSLSPDVVVVSGDLTQRATRDQFEAAKTFIGRLPQVPTLVIPGNHDVPLYRLFQRFSNPHGLYKEIISEDLNPVICWIPRSSLDSIQRPLEPPLAMVAFIRGNWITAKMRFPMHQRRRSRSLSPIITSLRPRTTCTTGPCQNQNELLRVSLSWMSI